MKFINIKEQSKLRSERLLKLFLMAVVITSMGWTEALAAEEEKAAPASMHVVKSTENCYVGEAFTYELLIRLAQPSDKVVIDEIASTEELAVKFMGQTKLEKNGVTVVSAKYQMIPLQLGQIMMPMVSAEVGGEYLSIGEDDEEGDYIVAQKLENFPGMSLVRTVPQRNLYVGEPFLVHYRWTTPLTLNGFRAVSMNLPLLGSPFFKSILRHDGIDPDDKAAIGLPIGNTRMIGRYEMIEKDELKMSSIAFSKIVTAQRPGKYTLASPALLTSFVGRTENLKWQPNYPSYFNNNFFERADNELGRRFYTESEPSNLNILPLPDTGKPRDFYGCVGACEVSATASHKVLRVGEPITLTVTISGYKHPEVFELAELSEQLPFSRQFSLPSRAPRGKTHDGVKTYVYTLRPLSQDVTAIPPIRVPYFNPETQSYAVAESPAIAITVKASELVTAYDALLNDEDAALRNQVSKNPEGIHANVTKLGERNSFWTYFLLAAALPPIAFLAYYLLSAKSRLMRDDPVKARSKQALKHYQARMTALEKESSQLANDEKIQRLDAAVRAYFADKLNLISHAHTFAEVEQHLAQGQELEVIREVYTAAEIQLYQEQDPALDMTALIKHAKQSIRTLNQRIS